MTARSRRWGFRVLGLAALLATGGGRAENPAAEDEALLQKAHVKCDGDGLCEFLRQRSLTDDRLKELRQHIHNLGSKRFSLRQRATRALVAQGTPALPFLREALNHPDVEVSTRARQCIDAIGRGPGPELAAAAVRLLARRAPAGAVQSLLFYLPFADTEAVAEEVIVALVALCDQKNRVAPALVTALRDPLPVRRGAAAYVVGWKGNATERAQVRRLLQDQDPMVRFQAAHGLVSAHDSHAVGVLIALVREGPDASACEAEEVLLRMAGDQSPQVTIRGEDRQARLEAAAAWERWWRQHRPNFDWNRVQVGPLGGALVAELETDVVWEVGPGGKARWEMEDLQGPYDVQALGGGRVLVAEYTGQRVTERDRHGKVLWQYRIDSPVTCLRLPGGNTFLATAHGALEISPRNQKVYSFNVARDQLPVYGACKARGSGIVYLVCQSGLLALDPSQKPILAKPIPVEGEVSDVEALTNGHLLVTASQGRETRALEIDPAGKLLGQTRLPRASSATRLANGQILAISKSDRRLTQLDNTGKIVWQKATVGRPIRVHRR